MVLRLLFALLLAGLALPTPAPASCHDASVASHATAMPGDAPDRHAVPTHACIGCIPPGDWLSPRVAEPVPVRVAPLSIGSAKRLFGNTPPPDLPPPREV